MTLEERIQGLRLRALYRAVEVGNANQVLLEFVRTEIARCPRLRILDVGCGAARNAAPMAALGGTVIVRLLAAAITDAGAILPMLFPPLANLLWGFRDVSGSLIARF